MVFFTFMVYINIYTKELRQVRWTNDVGLRRVQIKCPYFFFKKICWWTYAGQWDAYVMSIYIVCECNKVRENLSMLKHTFFY